MGTLSVTVTESSTANHGISWNAKASHSSSIEIGGEMFGGKGTYDFGFEHGYGSQHDWGTSTSSQVTISKTPEVTLEGKTGVDISLEVTRSTRNVPYTARVRVTYEDGSAREVTDRGTLKKVTVAESITKIGERYRLEL